MDIIQRTMSVFSALLEKVRTIGTLLKSNCLPAADSVAEDGKIFWIFNW